ncbi:MAG: hypothetical protein ACXW32_13270, partial [Limisphaerales bacterium]
FDIISEFCASLAFGIWEPGHFHRLPSEMSTFPSQVPATANCDRFISSFLVRGKLEPLELVLPWHLVLGHSVIFSPSPRRFPQKCRLSPRNPLI